MSAADRDEHFKNCVFRDAVRLKQMPHSLPFRIGQRKQEVFGTDVLVFELIGFFEGILKDAAERGTDV